MSTATRSPRRRRKAGVTPQEYADRISAQFRALWPELAVTNDYFIRTTDANHVDTVRRILRKVHDAGDIYFGQYEGFYCVGCERFYMEKELVDGKCPQHETVPEHRKESNYFFRMGKYQEWLIRHIEENPEFIRPERYRNEALAFLREPLEDLCISRPKSRLDLGDHAAVRRKLRDLRLVRRADQLRHGGRLSRTAKTSRPSGRSRST